VPRRDRADMADAEPEQEPRGIGAAFRLDGCQQVIHRLVLPPLTPDEIGAVSVEAEDVAGALVEPAELHELKDGLLAQPFDVERPPAGEVPQPLELLRAAHEPAGAAYVGLAFLGHRLAAAPP